MGGFFIIQKNLAPGVENFYPTVFVLVGLVPCLHHIVLAGLELKLAEFGSALVSTQFLNHKGFSNSAREVEFVMKSPVQSSKE